MADICFNIAIGAQKDIILKPIYEGIPVPDQAELITTSIAKQSNVGISDFNRAENADTVTTVATGSVAGTVEFDIITKYTGNDSYVENVGIATKRARIGVYQQGEISALIEDGSVVGAGNNRFYFELVDGDGNPINNAKFVSMDITKNPKNKYILAGWGNGMYPVNAGVSNRYWVSLNTTSEPGEFKIVLTISIPDVTDSYTLPPMTFITPGTPLKITVDPNNITAVADEVDTVTLVMTQGVYSSGEVAASGSMTNVTATGVATLEETIIETDTKGTYTVKLKSTGQKGTVKVEGYYLKNDDSLNYTKLPFSFTVKYT